ncbi:Ubiquitin fusion degradation protein [Pleurostoma richardsiae]|uniref:Ubiquitin fusion degradation protein n=1 Tax=Pleurostoma richardsiae TaxID=41990 RepID=A0AA38RAX7_9PEZI|nr:Ubiquitin fusion degradation protein [Pleurostoma richardsiae]
MADPPISLAWSASFTVVPPSTTPSKQLEGDKILLPQSALEQLLAESTRHPTGFGTGYDASNPYLYSRRPDFGDSLAGFVGQLPNPLMFRLVNTTNGKIVYAGIREFSAEENQIILSPYLSEALGIEKSASREATSAADAVDLAPQGDARHSTNITITVDSRLLPKGTYVRLRPLEAGYNPDDWKSLLERHLRGSFTTLTKDTMLSVRGVKGENFRFLIDKFEPGGDGICVVDTDLVVDIEALNEEQARETIRQIVAKAQTAPGKASGSSVGGLLDIWKPIEGQVLPAEYADYELSSWDRSCGLSIELSGIESGQEIDLFVSPKSTRQRVRPRDFEHVFADFSTSSNGAKRLTITSHDAALDGAESLLISVHGYSGPGVVSDARPCRYKLRATIAVPSDEDLERKTGDFNSQSRSPDDEQCANCLQWVPKRTMVLHENFCLRNNIVCPHCKNVFRKQSPEWTDHWHCEFGDGYGSTPGSRAKHDAIFHTPRACPSCGPVQTFPSLPLLAQHRTTVCPAKLILCRFCHLEVAQEGDPTDPSSEAETALTGLTAHERADGSRTTDCHLCGAIVRLRDMAAHLAHHELDKKGRLKPDICRDELCGRTLHGVGPRGQVGAGTRMGQGPGNELGLCSICFGPLYVSMHDPEGRALRRRIERRYLTQLMTGCGKSWCANEWCKTGRRNLGVEPLAGSGGAAATLPLVKPLLAEIADESKPLHFCVDEGGQKRRAVANALAQEGIWDIEWCVAACESEGADADKAREWLWNWAPAKVNT